MVGGYPPGLYGDGGGGGSGGSKNVAAAAAAVRKRTSTTTVAADLWARGRDEAEDDVRPRHLFGLGRLARTGQNDRTRRAERHPEAQQPEREQRALRRGAYGSLPHCKRAEIGSVSDEDGRRLDVLREEGGGDLYLYDV